MNKKTVEWIRLGTFLLIEGIGALLFHMAAAPLVNKIGKKG